MSKQSTVPVTQSISTTEKLHGHLLHDNYRWLEDVQSKGVSDWMDQQVEYTKVQHKIHTQYDAWKFRVKNYIQIDKIGLPVRKNGRHFFVRQRADEDLLVLWVRDGDNGEERRLLDLNELRIKEGDPTLEFWNPSSDGRLLAYAISAGGAEIPSLHILDIESGKEIEPVIPNADTVSWNDDNTGFYYTRGPKPGTVPDNDLRMNTKLYFHQLGDMYTEDIMVFGKDRPVDDMLWMSRAKGAPYIALAVRQEWSRNELYLIDVKTHAVQPFVTGLDAAFDALPTEKGMVVWTNLNANNAKLLFIDYDYIDKGIEAARVIVPEGAVVIQQFWLSKSRVFVGYTKDLADEIHAYDYDGTYQAQLPTTSLGVSGLSASLADDIIYMSNQTPISPTVIYQLDAISLRKQEVERVASPHNPSDYVAYLEWTVARDGVRMPMLIAHRKELKRDGKTPTLLYGYGGFATSEDATYLGANMAWLEAGGVFVDAVIRGGGEYGRQWHKDGILEHKQTSFDDFISHGKNLIQLKITDSEHLGIYGGSNGGLLVGAVAVQRPDLYKAVMSQVPLLDMVHFHKLLIASRWVNEYGDPEKQQDFERILTWSPYHNVKDDGKYPAFYLTTAEHDTRVHPMHAIKMTAKLQNVTKPSTVLLWVERGTGHTGAMPKTKSIDAITRRLSFFGWQLGLKVSK